MQFWNMLRHCVKSLFGADMRFKCFETLEMVRYLLELAWSRVDNCAETLWSKHTEVCWVLFENVWDVVETCLRNYLRVVWGVVATWWNVSVTQVFKHSKTFVKCVLKLVGYCWGSNFELCEMCSKFVWNIFRRWQICCCVTVSHFVFEACWKLFATCLALVLKPFDT